MEDERTRIEESVERRLEDGRIAKLTVFVLSDGSSTVTLDIGADRQFLTRFEPMSSGRRITAEFLGQMAIHEDNTILIETNGTSNRGRAFGLVLEASQFDQLQESQSIEAGIGASDFASLPTPLDVELPTLVADLTRRLDASEADTDQAGIEPLGKWKCTAKCSALVAACVAACAGLTGPAAHICSLGCGVKIWDECQSKCD